MPVNSISLPVLPEDQPIRITPTVVSQFVRAEQCERFLRFSLAERAKQQFMQEYDVVPQRIPPLFTYSGQHFEESTEDALKDSYRIVNFASLYGATPNRASNADEVVQIASKLNPHETVILLQVRLIVVLQGWEFRGDIDLVRLHRQMDGTLQILICDMKSSTKVKVEHRLQVAFYRLMLEQVFRNAQIDHEPIQLGILFRQPVDPSEEEKLEMEPYQKAATVTLSLKDALLEVINDPEGYLQSARDLVLADDSVARRVAQTPFEEVPYCLSFKCDGCLYNSFCMKWSAEHEDLSLLPYVTTTEKDALHRAGITTIDELAKLKELNPDSKSLIAVSGKEDIVKQLAAQWGIGPRLDELIHRARKFRQSMRHDQIEALSYIPETGNSTLPISTPDLNPNLVWVYVDAQKDHLEDRLYLLGAMVVACRDGQPVNRECVIRITDGPPQQASQERTLLVEWSKELVQAVVKLAINNEDTENPSAPIHVVFYDSHEQRILLDALARNFPPLLKATPPLYDFLTQLAAFDSPIATYLSEEIRAAKNYPMTCQSLYSVAQYLRFDWKEPLNFRELFKARIFDNIGKMDIDGQSEWYTQRSRFSSSIPLEYAYGAWETLPVAEGEEWDPFADFRDRSVESLLAFQKRRLEALEHVAHRINGNPFTSKTPFILPDLAHYEDKARNLAQALHEFITIERFVELNDWKRIRHAPPERRMLMGESLIVRYCEEDQEQGIAEQNRENERRRQLYEQYRDEYKAKNPEKKRVQLTKEQRAETARSVEGMRIRLRVETEGVDCDLNEALALSNIREGERLILYPRWTVDERLPVEEQQEFTPTPKQMLYGNRAELVQLIAMRKDENDRVIEAIAEVDLKETFGGTDARGFTFNGITRNLGAGQLYTFDSDVNNWYGYWCAKVVDGLCDGENNTLYNWLVRPPSRGEGVEASGQRRFLEGLQAFHNAGYLHDFEISKRSYIGGHANTPILMVQGPPGTGKSYSTAFAIFARIQEAMSKKRPFRVFLSCKTHAATDVLLKNVLEVQEKLRALRRIDANLFVKFFDERLLEVPLYRVAPKEIPPEGIIHLLKDNNKEKGEAKNTDIVLEYDWGIVGITPGGTYGMLKAKWSKHLFGHELCDLLVLDEASQMNIPEALMAALPLKSEGQLIVVGDHRQMPPIVKHDWEGESRRTFRQYQVYASLFDMLRLQRPPMIQFEESFRLHKSMAEFLRQEIYRHDGIHFHSRKEELLNAQDVEEEMVSAILQPEFPLIVVMHDERGSQMRNPFEQTLITPVLHALADPESYGLEAEEGLGIVVPHRAQRAALQQSFPELSIIDPDTGLPSRSAIDTVERFQGGERTVILVSATESDRAYLLASSKFLLDPRRLTVALSRAKRKMILVASKSIFSLFNPDEEVFANALLWKNLLLRTCSTQLWEGNIEGKSVIVRGGN